MIEYINRFDEVLKKKCDRFDQILEIINEYEEQERRGRKQNCQCDKCWNMRKNLRDKAVPLGEAPEAACMKSDS